MCEIRWCKSKKLGTIPVYENIGDGSWLILICKQCAEAIGVRKWDDLPDSSIVRTRVIAFRGEEDIKPYEGKC